MSLRHAFLCAILVSLAPVAAHGATKLAAAPAPNPPMLSLADAQKIALASSPLLAVARAAVDQAKSAQDLATSGALPNLSASGSTDRTKTNFRTGTGTVPLQITSNQASVNLKQLIFDGGKVEQAIRAAHFSTDAANLQLQRQVQTVLFNVAQAYYQTLQARHQLVAAQDSYKLAQTQFNLVEAQFHAGVAAKADVLTAELPVSQAQLAVAQAENGERTQLASLLDTMGVSPTQSFTLQDDQSVSGALPNYDDVLATAGRNRPDLLAARLSTNAAGANVRSARAGHFPVFSGTASDGAASTAVNGGAYQNQWSVGLSVSVPIFDAGVTRAETESAIAQLETAQANEKTTELGVGLSVQQAYLGLQTARSGLTSATVELSQARTVLDVTNAQYRAGVTTLPLLLNAQVGLTKAETDYTVALYTYKIAQQSLALAEGTIGPT